MKSQPFATKWRVVFSLFASCGIFALAGHAATCSGSMPTGPTAYVATSPNLVTVLDASTNTVACTVTVGANPGNLAASPDSKLLFVENDTDGTVTIVNLADGSIANGGTPLTITGSAMTANLAVSPDNSKVYVVTLPAALTPTTQANLYVISLPSLTVSGPTSVETGTATPVTGPGLGIAFTPDASKAYIATEGLTYIVNTAADSISTTTLAVSGGSLSIDQSGTFAYVVDTASSASTAVSQILLSNNTVTTLGSITMLCTQGNTIVVPPPPTSNVAYYSCQGDHFIQAVDFSSGTPNTDVQHVAVSAAAHPLGLFIASDGKEGYVALDDGTVALVNTSVSPNTLGTSVTLTGPARGIVQRPVQVNTPISPSTASVPTGLTQQFTSSVLYAFSAGQTLTWEVNGTAGGNLVTTGSISPAGLYTAPNTLPSTRQVMVTAGSSELPAFSGHYSQLYPLSATVTVTPSQLVFTVQPSATSTQAGTPFSVAVTVEDASGNTDGTSTASITITAASVPIGAAGFTGTSTTTVVAANGVATFGNLILTQANIPPPSGSTTVTPYSYTVTAASTTPGLTSALSNPFTISSAAAAKLVFTTGPVPIGSVAGTPLNPAPGVVVTVEDAFNNVVTTGTGSTALITIASAATPAPPATPVGGITTVTAANGVATFSNLILTQVGTTPLATTKYNYTLIAVSTIPPLISPPSNPFTIAPGAATQLAFNTQPVSGTAAGSPLAPPVVVYVEDATGLNVVTSGQGSSALITMTPTSTPSGIITFSAGSMNSVQAVAGVATFGNLILTQANIPPASGSTAVTLFSYTMTAASSSPALTSPPSNPFAISPAAASKLVFTTQPANSTAAVPLGAVDLAVEDTFSNVVTTGPPSNASITITSSAASGSSACFAGGGPPPPTPPLVVVGGAVGGVAAFNGLTFTLAGSYTLTAQTALPPSLPASTTSSSFTISAGPAHQLVFKTEPANGTAGIALAPVVVCVDDANNNVVTDPAVPASMAPILISSASSPSGAAGATGTTAVNAVAGVATFNNLILIQVGIPPFATTKYNYTLTATSGTLTPASTTPAITIVAGSASKLVFSVSPGGSNAGLPVQNVGVFIEDANNNLVTDPTVAASTASITITSASTPVGAASVSGTTTVAASGGVATFGNLILTQVGTTPLATTVYNYTLTAKVSAPGALTGLTAATSSSFTIAPGAATQLAFAQPLTSGVTPAGSPLANVAVFVEDAFTNVVKDPSVPASTALIMINSASSPTGAAAVAGLTTVPASGGVATFGNLMLTNANIAPPPGSTAVTPYSYMLAATSVTASLTSALSNSFSILPAMAAKLVYTTEPANGRAGVALGAVNVAVEDAFSNVVTSGAGSNASIAITSAAAPVTPPAAPVGGTAVVAAVGGVATFGNLILTQVGTMPLGTPPYTYTLTANSTGLTSASSSPAITIAPGAPAQLAFNVQPTSGTPAGSALNPVVVYVEDATGLNVVTSGTGSNASITITSNAAPANPPAAPLGGITTVSAAGGVATFSNLVLTQVGTTPLAATKYNYTLTASSGGIASASSSQAITIVPGAATQLVFSIQPVSGTAAGSALASVVVYVEDATGLNVVTSSNAPVTMTPTSTPPGITNFAAGSTTLVTAVGGVANFSNLILTQANIPPPSGSTTVTPVSYTMAATSTAPASTTGPSNSFTILPAASSKLVFTTQPVNGTTGNALAAVTVGVEDQFGNVATSNASNVSMTISAVMPAGQGGFTNDSTPTVAAAGGIATFANLKPTRSATLALTANDASLAGVTSNSFVVVGDPAGVTPGSAGGSQSNPLNIALTQNTVSTTINLLGPAPSDGVTFTIACAQPTPLNSSTPFAGVACAPSQSAPFTTMGSASGNTPIPITINVVRSSSATAAPSPLSPFAANANLAQGKMFALLVAMGLFVLSSFSFARLSGDKTRYGFAFALLLCLCLAWMAACTQFSTPNVPAPPVNSAQSGAGSAVVTITPSGPGPGGDNYQTKTITVYFNVQ